MKIISLLGEQEQPSVSSLPISQIKTECSEFLANPVPLYRGVAMRFDDIRPFADEPIRQDRKSLSGKHQGTAIFNKAFEQKFHFPKVRNRCLFATNSVKDANEYGQAVIVIPKNGANVAYAKGVSDSINIVGETWFTLTEGLNKKLSKQEIDEFVFTAMKLNSPNIPDNWFEELLNTLTPENQAYLKQRLQVAMDEVMSKYEVSDVRNFPRINIPTEYMLFNTNSYWMIHPSLFNVDVKDSERAWEELMKVLI